MRLLVLTPEFDGAGGGIITFYRNLLPALTALDVEVRVIEGSALHAGERDPRVVDGIAVETLERERLERWSAAFSAYASLPGLRRHMAAAWAMWEQAAQGSEFDVVEAADWGLLYVPGVVEGTAPLVVQAHGSVGQISMHDPVAGEEGEGVLVRLLERALLAKAALQTSTQANANAWRAETGGAVDVIRPAWRSPGAEGSVEPITDRGLVVGRLQRWKGPQVVCEALQQLGDAAPGIDWLGRDTVWGEREVMTSDHLAKTYPQVWARKISRLAPMGSSDVGRLQRRALFNLIPSTWDVFNFTVVEALASGRPAVVSAGAGASELIRDGENGFLFEAGDASGLASVIRRIKSASPETLSAIGQAGAETVRQTLDAAAIARQRLKAYQAVIKAHAAAAPSPITGWLGDACRPQSAPGDERAHLEGFPVRILASHLAERIVRKFGIAR